MAIIFARQRSTTQHNTTPQGRLRYSSGILMPCYFFLLSKLLYLSKFFTYNRVTLATSKVMITDDIALCPKHSSFWKVWDRNKPAYAICGRCGGAFCKDHIIQSDKNYYCQEHAKLTLFHFQPAQVYNRCQIQTKKQAKLQR